MAVKIRLKRLGKIRAPHYRIVVADSRTKRDGKAIEEIGKYHPKEDPSYIEVDSERVQYWLSVGAQPSEPVLAILKKTGDWQKFKGLPAPKPLLQPSAKADKKAVYDEALKAAYKESGSDSSGKGGDGSNKGGESSGRKSRKKAESPSEEPAKAEASAETASQSASSESATTESGGGATS